MSVVAIRDNGGLPSKIREPELPPIVKGAVAHYLNPDPHAGPRVRLLPEAMRKRAAAYVEEAEAADVPADVRVVKRWLISLSALVSNKPDPTDFGAVASAMAVACSDLPAWAWNDDTLKAAMRKFQWFPSGKEVHDLLTEETKGHRDTTRALKALAAAVEPVPEPEAPRMTEEERAAASATLRDAVAEAEARADASEAKPPELARSRCLTSAVIAQLRANDPRIQAAIKMRAEMKGGR